MPVSSLLCISALVFSLGPGRCVPISSVLAPFAGIARERLLYTESKRHGLFLQLREDGSVDGSSVQSAYCVLELRSIRAGETVIRGVATSLFLCVDPAGQLRGQKQYKQEDCTFRELLLDSRSLFLSPHTGLPVSLPSKRFKGKHGHSLSWFLPVLNTQKMDQVGEAQKETDSLPSGALDSDDPFGVELFPLPRTVFSPSMHIKK
ncbi:fibroblast growth factor 21 [Brachyhypopomus gauderio]|uniref:fibroblast growth factor 21 n=1 Tax=Brachyhypopomus gauderio TaxID=698409 RepID=UPI004041F140